MRAMTPKLCVLFALLVSLIAITGCESPRQRVATAEKTYASTARLVRTAVVGDLITDPDTLVALKIANDEANAALKDANAKVQADTPITSDFYLDRVESALARWLDLLTKTGVK